LLPTARSRSCFVMKQSIAIARNLEPRQLSMNGPPQLASSGCKLREQYFAAIDNNSLQIEKCVAKAAYFYSYVSNRDIHHTLARDSVPYSIQVDVQISLSIRVRLNCT